MNANDIEDLQAEQDRHDEFAHRDILNLPVERRLTHMALHFAKYAGRLIGMQDANRQVLERIIVDTTIICLCSANALRLPLGQFEGGSDVLRPPFSPVALPMWLGSQIAVHNGGFAKACEAFDHGEDFPYDEVLSASVLGILRSSLAAAETLPLDLATAIRSRWSGIEERLRRRAA
jgi:hypothetical protein